MISVQVDGDFSKTIRYLERIKRKPSFDSLNTFGEKGVAALANATPKDSGKTASSWSYEVTRNASGAAITFKNSNINKGVPIAIILQYGHGTGTGGYVQGRDYINPAIQPVFDQLAEDAWKEVTSL